MLASRSCTTVRPSTTRFGGGAVVEPTADALIERIRRADHQGAIAAALDPLHAEPRHARRVLSVGSHADADRQAGGAGAAADGGDGIQHLRMLHLTGRAD